MEIAISVLVLFLLGVLLFLMAVIDDRKERQVRMNRQVDVWVRTEQNPTKKAYSEWLSANDWQTILYMDSVLTGAPGQSETWPHEGQPGYDERKESA